ncbi:hypothetical protein GCM10014715_19920 [Streptomyces spiralis]|uniref:Secreted protein n=1 Tax=Streptomyces spiralis TaxID=66376 RepID=A0A919DPG4_9ACTN|nr:MULTISPECIES: DUF6344 domain-containing protein [Streptomyces]GHE66202.1 hypothetical protein GCM10014715_19920 [Streptomyces spiralis]
MDQHKVVKLWTAIVTAFLALCTALGLITTTAGAASAASQSDKASKSTSTRLRALPEQATSSPWSRTHLRSLPPTMKQRIRAEAHGKSPSCRHRPLGDSPSLATDPQCAPAEPPARPTIPLQR